MTRSKSEASAHGQSRAVRSIATISRSVLRRAKHAHYARAICGALGAFTLTIACALDCGSRLGDAEVFVLAALLSLATFISWVRSESIEARAVLKRIDERLHLSGAFLSAHESCAQTPDAPLAQLGAAKLLQRVRPSQALEAAVPHTLGFVSLPLLGLLVLVQTVQVRDARATKAGRMTVEVGTVADHLADIERMNRDALSEMQRRELADIQRAAETAAKAAADQFLDAVPKDGPKEEPRDEVGEGDWRKQLRSVADDLDQMASEAQPGSDFAEQLMDAAAEAEALAMDSGPQQLAPSQEEAEAGDGDMAGSELGAGRGDAAPDESSGGSLDPAEGGAGPSELLGLSPEEASPEEASPDPNDPKLAVPDGLQESELVAEDGGATVASGEITQGASQGPAADQRSKVGALRPSDEAGDLGGDPSAHPAPGAPVPDEAEGLLDRSRWWPDRDDAIVRAWLAKRAPK